MLDKQDIAILREMFVENNHVLRREIRDEFHSVLKAEITGSERRMIARMDIMKDEVIDGTLDILNDDVLPRVHVLEQDMVTVKQELKLA